MILCGFVQAKALNLEILPMIHQAPRCGRHCFYFRCCQVSLHEMACIRGYNEPVYIMCTEKYNDVY